MLTRVIFLEVAFSIPSCRAGCSPHPPPFPLPLAFSFSPPFPSHLLIFYSPQFLLGSRFQHGGRFFLDHGFSVLPAQKPLLHRLNNTQPSKVPNRKSRRNYIHIVRNTITRYCFLVSNLFCFNCRFILNVIVIVLLNSYCEW